MAQMKPIEVEPSTPPPTAMQKILDVVERVGNRVPHPVMIFVILIGIVIVLSHVFYMLGLSVSYQVIDPATDQVVQTTTAARSRRPWRPGSHCTSGRNGPIVLARSRGSARMKSESE